MQGSELVARTLANAGVEVIFALSGNQIMPIFDACIDAKIRIIHTRHEAAAVFMADAYAQVTGKPGVALVTAAPGYANALGALYSAQQSESPVLFLSGDSPVAKDGQGAFQELDQVAMSAPLTKQSSRLCNAKVLGDDLAQALRLTLSGRQGPVHCALPFDVLNEDAGDATPPTSDAFKPEEALPPEDAISSICAALASAARPVILTGPQLSASRAGKLLDDLASATDAPVIAMESPRGLKDPSLGAVASVLSQADVIVSLGKRFDFMAGFGQPPVVAEDCKLYIADPDASALKTAAKSLGPRLTLTCHADAPATARALIEKGQGGNREAYRKEVAAKIATRQDVSAPSKSPLHPTLVCTEVQALLDDADDAILIVDGGEFGQWSQACLSAETRIINGPSGAIGGALCYALGAKTARPDALVIVLMGDGTIGFHLAEFETAHRAETDFLAIIGNDARWNAEYQIQIRDYGENRTYACELNPTRYDEVVAGLGGHGEHVTSHDQLRDALLRAQKSGLPACINVAIEGVPAPTVS